MSSKPDPTSYLFVGLILGVLAIVALLFAFIVVVPIAAIAIAGFFVYRHYQFEKIKGREHLPATIKDRPEHMTPQEFYDRVVEGELLANAEEETGRYSCRPLADAFAEMMTQLYADESFHAPPPRPDTSDQITIGRYYDQLETWQRKVSDKSNLDVFAYAVTNAYLQLRKHFPKFALLDEPRSTTSLLTTPLQIFDNENATKTLISEFFDPELKKRKLFEGLRVQLEENYKENNDFVFDRHFAGTPFKALTRVQIPLPLHDETRFAGMWCVAPQGMGKTTLLHAILSEDIEKDAAIILMDSKGDLIEPFLEHPALASRRIIIGPDHPIGMNPLDIPHTDINKAIETIEYLFASLLDFKLTGTQSMLLRAVCRSLIQAFPDPSLATFQELMAKDGEKKYAEHLRKLDPDLQNFFANEFNSQNIRERRQEVLQRLRSLLDHDLLRSMLMAPKTTFRMGQAMDEGAVIIINNSRGTLGNKGAEFFGRFFIAQVLAAAQERSFRAESAKKPVYFYIDEAHTVVAHDERITDVLHECRAQKVALCVSHQETGQLSEKVLSAFQNCAIRFSRPDDEARRMSISLRMDVRKLHGLRQGQFGAYVRGLAKEGLIVNVRKADLSDLRPSQQPYRAQLARRQAFLPPVEAAPPEPAHIDPPAPEPAKQSSGPASNTNVSDWADKW